MDRRARRQGCELLGGRHRVVGERSDAFPEHSIAWLPRGDIVAHRLNHSSEVGATGSDPGPTGGEQGAVHQSCEAGLASHHVPVARVDRRGMHADENLPFAGAGARSPSQSKHLRPAVAGPE